MSPVQAHQITPLPSLIPPKLSDYAAVLLIGAAIRQQQGGYISRVECIREIEQILGRTR